MSGYLIDYQILRLTLDNYDQKIFFSDERQDGQLFASQGRFVHPVQDSLPSPYYLKAHLSITDRPYYLYHESIAKQNNAADNPFAEPVFLYTNVQGRIGIFAAYNQMEVIKKIN